MEKLLFIEETILQNLFQPTRVFFIISDYIRIIIFESNDWRILDIVQHIVEGLIIKSESCWYFSVGFLKLIIFEQDVRHFISVFWFL